MNQDKSKNQFQNTLNLPQTSFSIRANAATKEVELLGRWEDEGLNEKVNNKQNGKEKFILHDGPPFANGHLHMGHALTYILKDIICKAKRMAGYNVPLIPGWDCHGLPIELKVMADQGLEKGKITDRVAFKSHCRAFVNSWIAIQTQELKNFGKLADYKKAYVTMYPSYESFILKALATFVEKGFIQRKQKTVPWCATCQTVLAIAEIEYKERKDPSIYVLFSLPDEKARSIFPWLFEHHGDLKIGFAVWTTTPWTLPLNRAVVINPNIVYVVIRGKGAQEALIVGQDRADEVCKNLEIEKEELATLDATVFKGVQVDHPCIEGFAVPVILDESVMSGEGTACLHSAPGCGPEDYMLGIKHGLEIFSPVSAHGCYTSGIKPAFLEGASVNDSLGTVIGLLEQKGTLLYKSSIKHSYPHCWRCHKGLIFRATHQWFCDLTHNDLVAKALKAIEKITFVPERGQARLASFVGNRSEWCISRQRQWGVPIPALLCPRCGWAHIDADMIRRVADQVATQGVEFWDKMTIESLVQQGFVSKNTMCKGCGLSSVADLVLERDILDGWFDSGVSSYAVLAQDKVRLGVPADVYCEGSDQHRGWFQSSLLCGMVLYDHPPMKAIVTHGFVVDEDKRKMSKSLGNGMMPNDVISKYSRDILRLWVASANFEDDLVISDTLLNNVTEVYKKIRNTCRFLLANLYDFDLAKNGVALDEQQLLDRYMMATLHDLSATVAAEYEKYHFVGVVQALNVYCANDLSAVYLDIIKDRLYVEKADSFIRRSAQTTMYHILDCLTRLMAPVLSFLAEEIADAYQKDKTESIHMQNFAEPVDVWHHWGQKEIAESKPVGIPLHQSPHDLADASFGVQIQGAWLTLTIIRDAVLKAIEQKRAAGIVKHSYEAAVTLYIDPMCREAALWHLMLERLSNRNEDTTRFLKDWFIVSGVAVVQDMAGLEQTELPWLRVKIEHAGGVKCPRCWRWDDTTDEQQLCRRCASVLKG